MRFGIKRKLSPRYIHPFEIHNTIGEMPYTLALTPDFDVVHIVFNVSIMWNYILDESHVL